MASHVSCQDYSNHSLAERLEVIAREVLQEIVLSLVQNGERLCCMIVFLHRLIAVSDSTV